MPRYLNVASHVLDVGDGRMLAPNGDIELDDDERKTDTVKAHLDAGHLVAVQEPKSTSKKEG